MELPEGERSEAIRAELRERLGIGRFTPAPDGFDPLRATARELLAHGYPAMPDPDLHPRLHQQWRQMMTRPMRMIEPQFAPIKDKGHGSRQEYGPPAGNGWGGSIAFAEKDDTVEFVSGMWTVPHIALPKPGNCICASWIGIDGANDDPNGDDSGDILQAGTTQLIIDLPLFAEYHSFAWCEWYPDPPVEITNLKVSPGDTMYCAISVYSPTQAGVHLLNVTTNTGVAFPMTSPEVFPYKDRPKERLQLVGNCAEWVIEAPVDSNMNLARFGTVYFDECVAGTQNGKLLTPGTGTTLPMYDVHGHDIAVPQVESDLLVKITYVDSAP